ncbi:MAG: exodeoxyribonuclease VII large subunit [bacterium]
MFTDDSLSIDVAQCLTVSELTDDIKNLLELSFDNVGVRGEISNFSRSQKGHIYFTLKDERSEIKCAFFRNYNIDLRFDLEDGMEVVVLGGVSVYRGECQIVVRYIQPIGWGAAQQAFEELKKKLLAEGLFAPERKRPLPLPPRRIGVVTSPFGAAIRDILRIIGRRGGGVEIVISPAQVQGESAPGEIISAIKTLNDLGGCDVIIVGRGGGSWEDLSAFNDEGVARAIAASKVPIISAVGHQTDFTIADFVADVRAETPSAAAELISGNREALREDVLNLLDRMDRAFRSHIDELRNRVNFAIERLGAFEERVRAERYKRLFWVAVGAFSLALIGLLLWILLR